MDLYNSTYKDSYPYYFVYLCSSNASNPLYSPQRGLSISSSNPFYLLMFKDVYSSYFSTNYRVSSSKYGISDQLEFVISNNNYKKNYGIISGIDPTFSLNTGIYFSIFDNIWTPGYYNSLSYYDFDVEYFIDTNIDFFEYQTYTTYNAYSSYFSNISLNGNTYDSMPSTIGSLLSSSSIPISDKFDYSSSEPINSLDFYLDPSLLSDSYDFEFNYIDNYDYSSNNISYSNIDSYTLTGLLKEGDLYHWVDIPSQSNDSVNWYIDLYDSDCTLNNTCSTLERYNFDGSGFYTKSKLIFNFDTSIYEQLKFRINITNANDYTIEFGDNYLTDSYDYIFYNYSALGDLNNSKNYNRISSLGKRFVTFSTRLPSLSSDILVYTDRYDDIYIDTFDTSSYVFIDYDSLDYHIYGDTFGYYRYFFDIGMSLSQSFYLNLIYNSDSDYFDYYIFIPNDLYYSYSNFIDDSSFINSEGDSITGGIIPDPNDSDYRKKFSFSEALKYFFDSIRELFVYITRFYNGLPLGVQYMFISILIIAAALAVIKLIL